MRHSSLLEVNLSFLSENFEKIGLLSKKAKILPMVKADAYGNGLVPISEHLLSECGVQTLGCASLGEALVLKQQCRRTDFEVMVFSDTEVQNGELRKHYRDLKITPVIHQRSDFEAFHSDPEMKKIPLVLKINTGMNRLGLTLDDLEGMLPALKNRGVKHLMTHFACSYYPSRPGDKTERQLLEFEKAKKMLQDAGVSVEETSVSNSGAIEQGIGIGETWVRPGLMLYGPYSVSENTWKGHQISAFKTKVLKTFLVKKGTPVGYGVHVAPEDLLIALLPIGYGDGFLTTASGASVFVNGVEGKIFGRVNMDMSFLSFPAEKEGILKQGDQVEIWDHHNQRIVDLATQMKTIPYQLMCAISPRIPRIYKVK